MGERSIEANRRESMVKLIQTKITAANLTTVPLVIRNALDVESGDFIKWCVENEKVVVYKVLKKVVIK